MDNGINIWYLDIETAPAKAYIWDLKTRYVPLSQVEEDGYVLCFAAGKEGSEEIEYWSIWDQGHEAMIERAWEIMDEADALIHFNGNRFDIPRLNTEFLIERLGPPSPSQQIDLFRTVAQNFKVLSKSMNHMLKILGLENKMAHKGMELWTNCMAGVKEDQLIMEEYNIQDVEVMEELYLELRPWIKNHPNRALFMDCPMDDGKRTCPTCGSHDVKIKSYKHTRTYRYVQYYCNNCGSYPRERKNDGSSKWRTDLLT